MLATAGFVLEKKVQMIFESVWFISIYFEEKVFKTSSDKSLASLTLKFPFDNRDKFLMEIISGSVL